MSTKRLQMEEYAKEVCYVRRRPFPTKMNSCEYDRTSKFQTDASDRRADDDDSNDPLYDHWTTADLLCLASAVLRSGDKNWVSVSRAIKPFGDTKRPSEWFTPKKCALQYSRLLKKVDDRRKFLPRTERETPEELLIKHLTHIRLQELHSSLDESRILACKLQSMMEMIDNGDIDHELDNLLNEVEKQDKNFEERYCEWISQREGSPVKRPSKFSPSLTKGKASAPRMDEYGRRTSVPYENSEQGSGNEFSGYDINSGEVPSISSQISPRAVTPPQPFFNPTSALASAAARQLAVATASVPHGHLLSRRPESSDTSLPMPSAVTVSPVSSVTLSAPTLSKLLEMPPSVPGKLPPLPTTFYSSDYLSTPPVSVQQSDTTPYSSPRKSAISEHSDTSRGNNENTLFGTPASNLKGIKQNLESGLPLPSEQEEQKPVISPEQKELFKASTGSEVPDEKPFLYKAQAPEKPAADDNQSTTISEKGAFAASSVLDVDAINKTVDNKSNVSTQDSIYEDYICSTSETDDSSSESSSIQAKTRSKESPKHSILTAGQSVGKKRKRKQFYAERTCSNIDAYDSSEGESTRPDSQPCKVVATEAVPGPATEKSVVSGNEKQSKVDDSDFLKTLTTDTSNVCQSPGGSINFLRQLDSMEKNNFSPGDSAETSLASGVTDVTTATATPVDSSDMDTGERKETTTLPEMSESSNLSSRSTTEVSPGMESSSTEKTELPSVSLDLVHDIQPSSSLSPDQTASPLKVSSLPQSEEGSPNKILDSGSSTISDSVSTVSDSSGSTICDIQSGIEKGTDITELTCPDTDRASDSDLKSTSIASKDSSVKSEETKSETADETSTDAVPKPEDAPEKLTRRKKLLGSPDVSKGNESSQDTCSASSEEKPADVQNIVKTSEKQESALPPKNPQKKQTFKYSRRGRRGGRAASRKWFEPSPSTVDSYPSADSVKETKSESSEQTVDTVLSDKDNQGRTVESDEDTVSDKGNIEPVKTKTSRPSQRFGRRGRRGRGRAVRKVIPEVEDSTSEEKSIKGNQEVKAAKEPDEQEEMKVEVEENTENAECLEQLDSQKKESDSATIEDSGASSQNSEKDFFSGIGNKDGKEFDDQEGGSDVEGNDSQGRKVPSESTDEAGDSLMKSLSDDKPLDNDCSSASPASTLTSEYLYSKCRDEKDDSDNRQWSPQSSAPTSQSVVTPTTSDSSDDTENSDYSEGTDQTANSNENSNSAKKPKKKKCRKDRDSQHEYKTWKKSISIVWREASCHKYANVFAQKVTDDVAPGYQSIVHRPMDLSLIKKNIDNGTIRTTQEFQRDMMLMFQNAIMYNSSDHDVYHMAVEMQRDVNKQIQDYLATQLIIQDKIKESSLSTSLRTARHSKSQGKSQRSSSKSSNQ